MKRHESEKRGKGIRRRHQVLLLLLAICLLSVPVKAENMIRKAKSNKITSGKIVTDRKGIRLQKKNGKYVTGQWVYFKGNVYCFKKNGYARRGRFFTYEGEKYYAGDDGVIWYGRWLKRGKYYYYLRKNGTLAANETLTISGRTYVFRKSGKLNTAASDNLKSDKYLFVGDSRVVGMAACVSDGSSSFLGQVSAGYSYLTSTAGPRVRNILKKNPLLNVVMCFGVNDLGNVDSYISYYKSLVSSFPRTDFYFMAVNPISRAGNAWLSNSLIESFNKKIKSAMGKTRYINTYTYLKKNGFNAWDGVHYDGGTYQKIFKYAVSEIEAR